MFDIEKKLIVFIWILDNGRTDLKTFQWALRHGVIRMRYWKRRVGVKKYMFQEKVTNKLHQ